MRVSSGRCGGVWSVSDDYEGEQLDSDITAVCLNGSDRSRPRKQTKQTNVSRVFAHPHQPHIPSVQWYIHIFSDATHYYVHKCMNVFICIKLHGKFAEQSWISFKIMRTMWYIYNFDSYALKGSYYSKQNHFYKEFEHSLVPVCENNQPIMLKIQPLIFYNTDES